MEVKTARRKDTYRPAFCASSFYFNHLPQFNLIQNSISHLKKVEQITLWIIICTALRRPQSWYAGLRNKIENNEASLLIFNLFQKLDLAWPLQLPPNISVKEFCRCVRLAPLPLAALNSLYHFYSGHYPLEILCYEPAPLELLKIQMQGKRVLTFEDDFQKWPHLKYGARDPLSFWLHDLIHAEHFFSHPQNLHGQIGFYRFMSEILREKILETLLLNTEFNNHFSYLISDMNSHPIHLIKTLKAHIQIHSSPEDRLWERISSMPIISAKKPIVEILHRVNNSNFSTEDALKLTAFFDLDLYRLTLS